MKAKFYATAALCALIGSTSPLLAAEVVPTPRVKSSASPTLRDGPALLPASQFGASAHLQQSTDVYDDRYVDEIDDVIFFTPGVGVNGLDLQEPRLTMRGFGVSNGQNRSTVKILRDGAPLTDIHGDTHATAIDVSTIDTVRVFRNAGPLPLGGDNLGGVIDFVSHTGKTTPAGLSGSLEGGATRQARPSSQAQLALSSGDNSNVDYFIGLSGNYEAGFRDNNEEIGQYLTANLGLKLGRNATTRFFLNAANVETELAGGLSPEDLLEDPLDATLPIQLGPLFPGGPIFTLLEGAEEDNVGRDIREGRIANETNFRFLGHDIGVGAHYTRRSIESPQLDLIGLIDQDGSEWGARLDVERERTFFSRKMIYRGGATYAKGSQTYSLFDNNFGDPGDLQAEADQQSKNFTGFVQGIFYPFKKLAVDLGAKYISVERQVINLDNNQDELADFTGAAAKIGALYAISETFEIFASWTRSYEPPSMSELTAETPTDFIGLDAQRANTREIGLRGSFGEWLSLDIVYFDSKVSNEIISVADPASVVTDDIFENADRTQHKGVEAGVDLSLFPKLFARRNAKVNWRSAYTYNDVTFVDAGPLGNIDGARLGGIPTHQLRTQMRYESDSGWHFAVNASHTAGDFFADHENTTAVPHELLLGFSSGLKLNDRVNLYASGENLTNAKNVYGIAPVLDQSVDNARLFTPATPRAVYVGMNYRF